MKLRDTALLLATGGAAAYALLRGYQKQTGMLSAIEQSQQQLQANLDEQSRYISQQNQALIWLYSQFDFAAPLPGMRGWSISPDFAALLVELLRRHQPRTVLEFGGGTSTLIAAKTMQQLGHGHIITVEAIDRFAEITRTNLRHQGVEEFVTVVHAPLTPLELDGQTWLWYDATAFDHVEQIDVMVVDGPAQYNNPRRMARYPALPCLDGRLSSSAIVVMDDTNREDEDRIAQRWLQEYPDYRLLKNYDYFEKGARVLEKVAPDEVTGDQTST